jgi:hypothetical protein
MLVRSHSVVASEEPYSTNAVSSFFDVVKTKPFVIDAILWISRFAGN